jgi:hypothetical protein
MFYSLLAIALLFDLHDVYGPIDPQPPQSSSCNKMPQ